MKKIRVFSRDAQFQKFQVLKTNRNKRYRYQEFLVEGVRNINQAVQDQWTVLGFLYSFEQKLSSWAVALLAQHENATMYELTLELMQELSGKTDTSELMAIIGMRKDDLSRLSLSQNPVLAMFDRPSNKGNLGTIIRSCDALGVEGLIITGHSVDAYDPDVIVSSMGSFFHLPVIRLSESDAIVAWIKDLRIRFPNLHIVGTTAHAQAPLYGVDLTGPVLFLIGNETDGLCQSFQELSDTMVTIPMQPSSCATSFNVACAASILFYETQRQRAIRLQSMDLNGVV